MKISMTFATAALLLTGCAGMPVSSMTDYQAEHELNQIVWRSSPVGAWQHGESPTNYATDLRKRVIELHPDWDDEARKDFTQYHMSISAVTLGAIHRKYCAASSGPNVSPNCWKGAEEKGCSNTGSIECCIYQDEIRCPGGVCNNACSYTVCQADGGEWKETSYYCN